MLETNLITKSVVLEFKLPYPPSTNHLFATVRGRRVKTAGARAYVHLVGQRCLVQGVRPRQFEGCKISLKLIVCPPDNRRRDISNTIKVLEDALVQHQICPDDCHIDELYVLRGRVHKPHGEVVVRLASLPEPMMTKEVPGGI